MSDHDVERQIGDLVYFLLLNKDVRRNFTVLVFCLHLPYDIWSAIKSRGGFQLFEVRGWAGTTWLKDLQLLDAKKLDHICRIFRMSFDFSHRVIEAEVYNIEGAEFDASWVKVELVFWNRFTRTVLSVSTVLNSMPHGLRLNSFFGIVSQEWCYPFLQRFWL